MKSDRLTIKWIYHQSKHIIFSLALLSVIGILLSVCGVSFALVSKNIIDVAVSNDKGNFIRSSINLAALIAAQLLFQVVFSIINIRIRGKLNISMRKNLFKNLLIKNYTSISEYHSGELVNRIYSDVSVVTNAIVEIIPGSFSFFARIILSFSALFMLDSLFALICLVIGPVILLVSHIYRKKIKKLYIKCQESDGKTRSFMQECLQNLLVIKSFKNEEVITNHSTDLQNENYKYNIKRNNISILANILFYITITIGYYFALAWGAYKLSQGLITFGTLTAMLQLVGQIQAPFRNLSSIFPQYVSMIASAERIIEVADLADESEINKGKVDCESVYQNMKEIVMQNISFSYDNNTILDNTDLNIKKGEFIVVKGSSGIGKSTLLKLLLGIILPTNGSAYIKLNNGDKLALDKKTRGLFAYVPQGNMILSGTIRDNITFANNTANDEEVIKCAIHAQIWDFIDSLPNKLDTVLGEKGLGLSEGQVQRIAIARAIYHKAHIILLDEATSALDEATEIALLNSIKELKDKTCIIVSHRKAAFEICHKAICIKNGKFEFLTYKK